MNQVLKSGVFVLENVEYPLGNGFYADFSIYHVKNREHSLLEVVSLHLNAGAVLDEKSFVKYFRGKVSKKLLKKKRSEKHGFILATVIWAEGAELRKIYDLHMYGMKIDIPGVLVPSAYLNYYNGEGGVIQFSGP